MCGLAAANGSLCSLGGNGLLHAGLRAQGSGGLEQYLDLGQAPAEVDVNGRGSRSHGRDSSHDCIGGGALSSRRWDGSSE